MSSPPMWSCQAMTEKTKRKTRLMAISAAIGRVSRRLRVDTRGIVVLIAINLALGFFFHSFIAWQAHIGGLLTGALLTAAYAYAPRRNRALFQAGATVLVAVVILVAVAVRSGQLTSGNF